MIISPCWVGARRFSGGDHRPAHAHAQPPVQCLTNTPKGKQVYIPCDLLNAGANYPPGQRCVGPLDQYPRDVRDWCG